MKYLNEDQLLGYLLKWEEGEPNIVVEVENPPDLDPVDFPDPTHDVEDVTGYLVFPDIKAAALWILENADWSDEYEDGYLTRAEARITRIVPRGSEYSLNWLGGRPGLRSIGVASNYNRRALQIAIETNDPDLTHARCIQEGLQYEGDEDLN